MVPCVLLWGCARIAVRSGDGVTVLRVPGFEGGPLRVPWPRESLAGQFCGCSWGSPKRHRVRVCRIPLKVLAGLLGSAVLGFREELADLMAGVRVAGDGAQKFVPFLESFSGCASEGAVVRPAPRVRVVFPEDRTVGVDAF